MLEVTPLCNFCDNKVWRDVKVGGAGHSENVDVLVVSSKYHPSFKYGCGLDLFYKDRTPAQDIACAALMNAVGNMRVRTTRFMPCKPIGELRGSEHLYCNYIRLVIGKYKPKWIICVGPSSAATKAVMAADTRLNAVKIKHDSEYWWHIVPSESFPGVIYADIVPPFMDAYNVSWVNYVKGILNES